MSCMGKVNSKALEVLKVIDAILLLDLLLPIFTMRGEKNRNTTENTNRTNLHLLLFKVQCGENIQHFTACRLHHVRPAADWHTGLQSHFQLWLEMKCFSSRKSSGVMKVPEQKCWKTSQSVSQSCCLVEHFQTLFNDPYKVPRRSIDNS